MTEGEGGGMIHPGRGGRAPLPWWGRSLEVELRGLALTPQTRRLIRLAFPKRLGISRPKTGRIARLYIRVRGGARRGARTLYINRGTQQYAGRPSGSVWREEFSG